jgi:hypothetical protein
MDLSPLTPALLPELRRFWRRMSDRPDDDAFVRWRYLEHPSQVTWLALRGGECVATISAYARRYRSGGEEVACLEPFDWACLPEVRAHGLGIRLLRQLRQAGRPTISVGGSADTLALAPRISAEIGVVRAFALPLAGALRDALRRRFGLPTGLAAALSRSVEPWFGGGRRPAAPRGARVQPMGAFGEELEGLYAGALQALVPVPEPAHLAWLTRGHAGGDRFVPLLFEVDGGVAGWSLSRVHDTDDGPSARIVELYAPRPTAELYAWMLSESVVRLLPLQPRLVEARASCPILVEALRRGRFREGRALPAYAWPAGALRGGWAHLGFDVGDDAERPYA